MLKGAPQEIPAEELEARDTDKIIDVFHFTKEPSRTHGVPFRFVVLPDEKFSDTKKRLQTRMGIPDGGMAKYRFALVQMAQFKQPSYIADGARIRHLSYFQNPSFTLLLEQRIPYSTISGRQPMRLAWTISTRRAALDEQQAPSERS